MFLKMSLLLNSVVAMSAPTALVSATNQEVEQVKWNCGGENILKSQSRRSLVLWNEERFWKEHIQTGWTNIVNQRVTLSHDAIKKMVHHIQSGRINYVIASLVIFKPSINALVLPHLVGSAYRWRDLDKGRGVYVHYLFGMFETNAWARLH